MDCVIMATSTTEPRKMKNKAQSEAAKVADSLLLVMATCPDDKLELTNCLVEALAHAEIIGEELEELNKDVDTERLARSLKGTRARLEAIRILLTD